MIDIIPLVVLAIASYRITRFLVIDTFFAGIRNKVHSFFVNQSQKQRKIHVIWEKLYDLTSCTWCSGFWVSLALYWLFAWNSPADWNELDIINVFAIAGIQGFLHALEPGDE